MKRRPIQRKTGLTNEGRIEMKSYAFLCAAPALRGRTRPRELKIDVTRGEVNADRSHPDFVAKSGEDNGDGPHMVRGHHRDSALGLFGPSPARLRAGRRERSGRA